MGPNDQAIPVYEQALNLYEQASRLPPTDIESRTIIARAYNRMGFTRAIINRRRPNAGLATQADSNYRHSISLFEALLAEKPGDPEIRSHFADALGEWGYGFFLKMTAAGRPRPAALSPRDQLRAELALDPGTRRRRQGPPSLRRRQGADKVLVPLLDGGGRSGEAQQLYRDLISTCSTLAGMHAGSQSKMQRRCQPA